MSPEQNQILSWTEGNNSFSRITPGLQLMWDSTSMTSFKQCPRRYFYSMIRGYTRGSVHLDWGKFLHDALETYDKSRTHGASHDDAQRQALRTALFVSGTYADAVDTETGEVTRQFFPWQSDLNTKTRFTLLRTVVWYTEEFKDDPAETVQLASGKAAVEMSFKIPLDLESPDGEPFTFCGHLDKRVRFTGQLWELDRKTTGSTINPEFFEKFTPDNQMSGYVFAGRIITGEPSKGMIIDGIQTAVGFSRFRRGFANRTDGQINEWLADLKFWIGEATRCAQRGHWPQNDTGCGDYGGCPYRQVCNKDPSVREPFLTSNFDRRHWDPSVPR